MKRLAKHYLRTGDASPPTRGRGLKLFFFRCGFHGRLVAPHTGAWIETTKKIAQRLKRRSRPPHGGVD